jgi:hypothetical protein
MYRSPDVNVLSETGLGEIELGELLRFEIPVRSSACGQSYRSLINQLRRLPATIFEIHRRYSRLVGPACLAQSEAFHNKLGASYKKQKSTKEKSFEEGFVS